MKIKSSYIYIVMETEPKDKNPYFDDTDTTDPDMPELLNPNDGETTDESGSESGEPFIVKVNYAEESRKAIEFLNSFKSEEGITEELPTFEPEVLEEYIQNQFAAANNLKTSISLKKTLCDMHTTALTSPDSIFTDDFDREILSGLLNCDLQSLFTDRLLDKINDLSLMVLEETGKSFNKTQTSSDAAEESFGEIPVEASVNVTKLDDLLVKIDATVKTYDAFSIAKEKVAEAGEEQIKELEEKIGQHLQGIEEMEDEEEKLKKFDEFIKTLSSFNEGVDVDVAEADPEIEIEIHEEEAGKGGMKFKSAALAALAATSLASGISGKPCIMTNGKKFSIAIPPPSGSGLDTEYFQFPDFGRQDFEFPDHMESNQLSGTLVCASNSPDIAKGFLDMYGTGDGMEKTLGLKNGKKVKEILQEIATSGPIKPSQPENGSTSVSTTVIVPKKYPAKLLSQQELREGLALAYKGQYGNNEDVTIDYSHLIETTFDLIIANAISEQPSGIMNEYISSGLLTVENAEAYAKKYLAFKLKKTDTKPDDDDLMWSTDVIEQLKQEQVEGDQKVALKDSDERRSAIDKYLDGYYTTYTKAMLKKLNLTLQELENDFNSLGKSIDTFGRHILDSGIAETYTTQQAVKQPSTWEWAFGQQPKIISANESSEGQLAAPYLNVQTIGKPSYGVGAISSASSTQALQAEPQKPQVSKDGNALALNKQSQTKGQPKETQQQLMLGEAEAGKALQEIKEGNATAEITDSQGQKLEGVRLKTELAALKMTQSAYLLDLSKPSLKIEPVSIGDDGKITVVYKFTNLKNNELLKSLPGLISQSVESKMQESKKIIMDTAVIEDAGFLQAKANNFVDLAQSNGEVSEQVDRYKMYSEFLARNTFLIKATTRIDTVLEVGSEVFSYLSPEDQAKAMQEKIAELKSYGVALSTVDALNAYNNANKENLDAAQIVNQKIASENYKKNLAEVTKLEVGKLNAVAENINAKAVAKQVLRNAEMSSWMQNITGQFEAFALAAAPSTETLVAVGGTLLCLALGAYKLAVPAFVTRIINGAGLIGGSFAAGTYIFKLMKEQKTQALTLLTMAKDGIVSAFTNLYSLLSSALTTISTTISSMKPAEFAYSFFGWFYSNPIYGAGVVFGTAVVGIGGYYLCLYCGSRAKMVYVDWCIAKAKKQGDAWIVSINKTVKQIKITSKALPLKVDGNSYLIVQSGDIIKYSSTYQADKNTVVTDSRESENWVYNALNGDYVQYKCDIEVEESSNWVIILQDNREFTYWGNIGTGKTFPIRQWVSPASAQGVTAAAASGLARASPVTRAGNSPSRKLLFNGKPNPDGAPSGGYIKPKAKKSTNKNRKANKTKKPRRTLNKNKKSKRNSSQKKNKNKKTKTKKHRNTIRRK
jgi:hypothetical protein